MDDYISRQAAITAIGKIPDYEDGMVFEALSHAQRDVALLPSADVQPVRHGHWIIPRFGADAKCSVCGMYYSDVYDMESKDHYCRNCGARMDGE